MGRACERAGLERRGTHGFRHSLATEMLRAGASLPEVGQVLRHRSMLSTSITDPYQQAQVLAAVAEALARARRNEQAETVARSITDPSRQAQAQALVAAAEVLVRAGLYEQGRQRGPLNYRPLPAAQALAAVAEALARADQHEQATAVARSIIHPHLYWRERALTAAETARVGQHDQAATAAAKAKTAAHSTTNPDRQARALVAVAEALAEGRYETSASRGFCSVCRRTMDDGAGAGVVAGAVGDQSAH
jgi:Phage integrase family